MKIKIFACEGDTDFFEKQINDWLSANPTICIHKFKQSESRDYLTITFLYWEPEKD